jgi:hypothetical protein
MEREPDWCRGLSSKRKNENRERQKQNQSPISLAGNVGAGGGQESATRTRADQAQNSTGNDDARTRMDTSAGEPRSGRQRPNRV